MVVQLGCKTKLGGMSGDAVVELKIITMRVFMRWKIGSGNPGQSFGRAACAHFPNDEFFLIVFL